MKFQVTTVFLDLITATKLKVSHFYSYNYNHDGNDAEDINMKVEVGLKPPPLILVKLPNANRCPLTETKNIENAGNDDEDNIMKVCAGWKVSL